MAVTTRDHNKIASRICLLRAHRSTERASLRIAISSSVRFVIGSIFTGSYGGDSRWWLLSADGSDALWADASRSGHCSHGICSSYCLLSWRSRPRSVQRRTYLFSLYDHLLMLDCLSFRFLLQSVSVDAFVFQFWPSIAISQCSWCLPDLIFSYFDVDFSLILIRAHFNGLMLLRLVQWEMIMLLLNGSMLNESVLSYYCLCCWWLKIKRCGEMARKIRFFKEQMSKAGVSPKEILEKENDIDLDDVEVNGYAWFFFSCFRFLHVFTFSSFSFSAKAWRARSWTCWNQR